ncbi:metal-dependent hydrolase [Aneurinibacillus sp. Ricciae_BoGa-3]|uniref:metal-dependent hydrolase n=1 Tax=Aneurinibacillus sp. Ricciae_BoGa-3 TaxID=3022697 RepID=UPI00234042E4|nr:metal-dependent hydrolase [Aneurinibacillus sp. Ricciae_BoGa-3]WCK55500.1 metal-dependent hydrolase [Aneurinibacillus sp. Ricciae_BoGa-3]
MHIKFHGHSCVQLTHNGSSIIIDPFLTGNGLATAGPDDIDVQYVLLTHAHSDHIGDALAIAKRSGATIIATHELATYMSWQGVAVHPMNIGGSFEFDFGTVKLTQAFHSSGLVLDDKKEILYMGMPAGFLITMGEKTFYHTGDTGLFSDLKLIGERHPIDAVLLPIGDNFTMGPDDALQAAEWIQAGVTLPSHYDTFPVIKQDAEAFVQSLEKRGLKGKVLKPGEIFEL